MIRLTNGSARSLLANLFVLKYRLGDWNLRNVAHECAAMVNRQQMPGEDYQALVDNDYGEPLVEDIDSHLADLLRQLKRSSADNTESIIDTIVEVLKSRYARNTLAGESLEQLKNALLRNDERIELSRSLRENTYCSTCGIEFRKGIRMLVSLARDSSGLLLTCHKCAASTHMACRGCRTEWTAIPDGVTKALLANTIRCEVCKTGKKAELPAEPENPFVEVPIQAFARAARPAPARPANRPRAVLNQDIANHIANWDPMDLPPAFRDNE